MLKTDLPYDKRLIERNLKRGAITREQYQKYLAELPDVAEKSERLAVDDDDEQGSDDRGEG